MGIEPIIGIIWLVAVVAGLKLSWNAFGRRQWKTAAGTLTGLAIGFAPLLIWPWQPMALVSMFVLAVPASISLVVSYAVRQRIERAVAATLLLMLPFGYGLFAHATGDRGATGGLDHALKLLGALVMLAGPLVCVLACREIAKIFDPRARVELH